MVINDNPWFFDIFSWEHLSAALTVFAVLTTTAAVPLYQLFKKRRKEHLKLLDEKETQKIKEIATDIVKPVMLKLDAYEEQQRQLKDAQRENDRNTKDTLNTVKSLVSEFKQYTDQQQKLNAKVYFMDGFFKNQSYGPPEQQGYKRYRRLSEEDDEDTHLNPNSNNNNNNHHN